LSDDAAVPLGRAHLLAAMAIRDARRAGIGIEMLMPVGDLRRYEPAVTGVALLGIVADADRLAALTAFSRLPFVVRSEITDDRCITVATDRGQLTLYLSPPDQAGAAMIWHTGSHSHVGLLQTRARARQLQLSEGRLTNRGGKPVRCPTENDFYRRIDLPYIAPELRAGADEIVAADAHALPALIVELHIRGDLHMHTTWSDGRDTTERMVLSAKQLGYEYLAITDHSQRAWSSHKLSIDDVPRQREEIESLRMTIPGIDILHGIEVDILTDGSLDFEDEILERFDIVLASLHVDDGHDGARLTDRYLRAIRHPLVNVITHPANRSPARSLGFDVDFDSLFAAAAETGTAMEIDGAPGHLDMDGAVARRAVAAGVTVAIDSDCHRAEWLARQMRFGVGTARRGWIEPRHVLNTRSVDDVRAFVARKRGRNG
jgi:DNA polymerase (family 10)